MSTSRKTFLQINQTDNLLVALQDLKAGTVIEHEGNTITLQDDIAAKHKFTTEAIPKDGKAFMYGVLVGIATQDIAKGGLIHTFNLHHASQNFEGKMKDYPWTAPNVSKWNEKSFLGYHRPDGQVGTQNYWLVIPLVFCENRNIELLKNATLSKPRALASSRKRCASLPRPTNKNPISTLLSKRSAKSINTLTPCATPILPA